MVEHPHRVEEDGDADEGLEVIQQLEDEAEGHVAAIATHFVAEFLGGGGPWERSSWSWSSMDGD